MSGFSREEWTMAIRKRGEKLLFEDGGAEKEFVIIPNSIRYWCADPFLINKDGREYVFFSKSISSEFLGDSKHLRLADGTVEI